MFDSFFLAGFESATGYNRHHRWIDQIAATAHDRYMNEDYRLLSRIGIRAARDAIRWPLVDRKGQYDFSTVDPLLEASDRNEITVIFDLFHYGYPADLDILSEEFIKRFAGYSYEVARYISRNANGPLYFTPVNEPSYLAFAAGQAGRFAPHYTGRGPELKVQLVRALIEGINAIRAVVPDARIVNVDPICRVVAPPDRPDLAREVEEFNDGAVFESLDMVAGRKYPELGGSRKHLDIVGLNYYWTNQWELGRPGETPLADGDHRRVPLRQLMRSAWDRYGGDLLITETSHVGDMRPVWVRELTDEAEAAIGEGIGLRGVCLYPILGMPEWHAPDEWTRMGLWDVHPERARVIYYPMYRALRQAQQRLENKSAGRAHERQRVSLAHV